MRPFALISVVALVLGAQAAIAGPVARTAFTTGGAADPAFNALINSFRSDLGGVLNPPGACSPDPCTTGRREVNWDGVPAGATSPNPFPGDFFNGAAGVQPAGRQRGIAFTTPGTGFLVSANDFSAETSFGLAEFDAFSPARLFASVGSPITDVTFSVPGTPGEAAAVNGFGAVFSDVDITGSTFMEFFGVGGGSLGKFIVPGAFPEGSTENSQGAFSFLGVSFNAGERISRVRITSGTFGIDGNFQGADDAVVMDDFIFGEPVVPLTEPSTLALLGAGLFVAGACKARRRSAAV